MPRTPSLEQVPLNVGAVGSAVPARLVFAHLVSPFSASYFAQILSIYLYTTFS